MQTVNLDNTKQKSILIAPLDWGLGHTTRCIPIINKLLHLNCRVIVAATGIRKQLLLKAFPSLLIIPIPDYNIVYGKNRWSTVIKIVAQFGKMKKAIKAENIWLQDVVKQYSIDIVISDNRYGLYNEQAVTVFITHQLQPKSLLGSLGENFIQKKLYRYINKFNQCWVMDEEGENNIAGSLSHPTKMPSIPCFYIGITTRLQPLDIAVKKKVLVILSGPEPQRTILENKILGQLNNTSIKATIIRGVEDKNTVSISNTNATIYNLVDMETLNILIAESEFVICRSGYTSIMDLLLLHKKCIFIPTPAQTEQEYLATYLANKNLCIFYSQEDFNITEALLKAEKTNFKHLSFALQHQLDNVIQNIVKDQ